MKDVYKQRVTDTIDSLESRTKVLLGMMNGERPSDAQIAKKYLSEILRGLENIQEIVDIS
jgi:hypothetical protein